MRRDLGRDQAGELIKQQSISRGTCPSGGGKVVDDGGDDVTRPVQWKMRVQTAHLYVQKNLSYIKPGIIAAIVFLCGGPID
jgi:hypothetical protein